MATLYRTTGAVEDVWLRIEGDQPVPDMGNVIVPLAALGDVATGTRTGELGVHVDPLDDVATVADHLASLALISLDFPSFADGTNYSKARLLRERHGFEGTLRATGDIRIDQIAFFFRCGFDELLITHEATLNALAQGRDVAVPELYQSALGDERPAGDRPWQRRWVQPAYVEAS